MCRCQELLRLSECHQQCFVTLVLKALPPITKNIATSQRRRAFAAVAHVEGPWRRLRRNLLQGANWPCYRNESMIRIDNPQQQTDSEGPLIGNHCPESRLQPMQSMGGAFGHFTTMGWTQHLCDAEQCRRLSLCCNRTHRCSSHFLLLFDFSARLVTSRGQSLRP